MTKIGRFILWLAVLVVGCPCFAASDTSNRTVVQVQQYYDPNNPDLPETKALEGLMRQDPSIQVVSWGGLTLPGSVGARSSLMMAIAGGTAPDIFGTWFHALNNDIHQGFFYPLNEWIGDDLNGDGQISDDEAKWPGWKKIPKLWRQVATVNGKIYALPLAETGYFALIFRADLVRQAGLDPNRPPETWDQFYYWCQKLTGPNQPIPGLPPPSQRGVGLTPLGFMWLPWMQSAGGNPIQQTRVSPTTGKAYTFEMEATDFRTPEGEDLVGVPPVWKANFDSAEGIAATAFYHRLRWGKWICDPETREPINLTEEDLAQGWVEVGHRRVTVVPDAVIVGVCRPIDPSLSTQNTGEPITQGQIAMEPAKVDDLLSVPGAGGLDPDLLSWFPFPAGGDHGHRVVQVQRHYLVMAEGVGRRPKAERDKVWAALTSMTSDEVGLDSARHDVLAGMARFVGPDKLQELGFTDYLAEIPATLRQNYQDMKTGQIRTFTEPYMGFWITTDSEIDRKVLSLILTQGGESFDYEEGLHQVEREANGGLMFSRSRASLDPYRPYAWMISAVIVGAVIYFVILIARSLLTRRSSSTGVHRRWLPWILLTPALLLIAVWSYYPLLRGMVMAFQNYKIVGTSPFVGFDNFITLCLDPTWWATLERTLYFVALNMTLAFLAPIVLALMLAEVPRGKILFRTLFFLPQVTSGLVIALLWRLMYDPTPDGFFNHLLSLLNYLPFVHIPTQAWLQDPRMAMICCVVPTVWASMGISSLIYLAALKGVPDEIYEAAEIDGAGIWHKLSKITLPSIFPLIVINFVGTFIGTFQSMGNILLLTFGGPGDATMVAGLRIWIEAYNNLRFSMATSMAWMLGMFLIAFTYLQMKILQRVEFKKANFK